MTILLVTINCNDETVAGTRAFQELKTAVYFMRQSLDVWITAHPERMSALTPITLAIVDNLVHTNPLDTLLTIVEDEDPFSPDFLVIDIQETVLIEAEVVRPECYGCHTNQPNQLAHYGGCIPEEDE